MPRTSRGALPSSPFAALHQAFLVASEGVGCGVGLGEGVRVGVRRSPEAGGARCGARQHGRLGQWRRTVGAQ